MPPQWKVRQTVPDSLKNKTKTHTQIKTTKQTKTLNVRHSPGKNPDQLRGMKGRSCVLLINISRGAARIVPHRLQQLL